MVVMATMTTTDAPRQRSNKWSILKQALLGGSAASGSIRGDAAEAQEASIHRHMGFRMFPKALQPSSFHPTVEVGRQPPPRPPRV